VERLAAQLYVKAERNALASEFELVATSGFHFEVGTSDDVLNQGSVGHRHGV
jgi:hypothetical protein